MAAVLLNAFKASRNRHIFFSSWIRNLAYSLNDRQALINMAYLLDYGDAGIAKHQYIAIRLFERIIDRYDHTDAMFRAALWYYSSRFRPNDWHAFKLLRKVISRNERHDECATMTLASLLAKQSPLLRESLRPNPSILAQTYDDTSIILLERVISRSGNPKAMVLLADILLDNFNEKGDATAFAIAWYQRAVEETNDAQAMERLGNLLWHIHVSVQKGVKVRSSKPSSIIPAEREDRYLKLLGKYMGFAFNIMSPHNRLECKDRAVSLYKRAIHAGSTRAMNSIADVLVIGSRMDYEAAAKLYTAAIRKCDVNALKRFAMHSETQGGKDDSRTPTISRPSAIAEYDQKFHIVPSETKHARNSALHFASKQTTGELVKIDNSLSIRNQCKGEQAAPISELIFLSRLKINILKKRNFPDYENQSSSIPWDASESVHAARRIRMETRYSWYRAFVSHGSEQIQGGPDLNFVNSGGEIRSLKEELKIFAGTMGEAVRNASDAFALFEKSAIEAFDADALVELATLRINGFPGLKRDLKQARRLCELALKLRKGAKEMEILGRIVEGEALQTREAECSTQNLYAWNERPKFQSERETELAEQAMALYTCAAREENSLEAKAGMARVFASVRDNHTTDLEMFKQLLEDINEQMSADCYWKGFEQVSERTEVRNESTAQKGVIDLLSHYLLVEGQEPLVVSEEDHRKTSSRVSIDHLINSPRALVMEKLLERIIKDGSTYKKDLDLEVWMQQEFTKANLRKSNFLVDITTAHNLASAIHRCMCTIEASKSLASLLSAGRHGIKRDVKRAQELYEKCVQDEFFTHSLTRIIRHVFETRFPLTAENPIGDLADILKSARSNHEAEKMVEYVLSRSKDLPSISLNINYELFLLQIASKQYESENDVEKRDDARKIRSKLALEGLFQLYPNPKLALEDFELEKVLEDRFGFFKTSNIDGQMPVLRKYPFLKFMYITAMENDVMLDFEDFQLLSEMGDVLDFPILDSSSQLVRYGIGVEFFEEEEHPSVESGLISFRYGPHEHLVRISPGLLNAVGFSILSFILVPNPVAADIFLRFVARLHLFRNCFVNRLKNDIAKMLPDFHNDAGQTQSKCLPHSDVVIPLGWAYYFEIDFEFMREHGVVGSVAISLGAPNPEPSFSQNIRLFGECFAHAKKKRKIALSCERELDRKSGTEYLFLDNQFHLVHVRIPRYSWRVSLLEGGVSLFGLGAKVNVIPDSMTSSQRENVFYAENTVMFLSFEHFFTFNFRESEQNGLMKRMAWFTKAMEAKNVFPRGENQHFLKALTFDVCDNQEADVFMEQNCRVRHRLLGKKNLPFRIQQKTIEENREEDDGELFLLDGDCSENAPVVYKAPYIVSPEGICVSGKPVAGCMNDGGYGDELKMDLL